MDLSLKSQEKKEADSVDRTLENERHMFLDATIVRIMKSQKVLKQELLMNETIEQSASRFKPKIRMIKVIINSITNILKINYFLLQTCIEKLIADNYLRRDPNDRSTLEYLAEENPSNNST